MKIGLTGSIACGKSTIAAALRQRGFLVADADAISHALTAENGLALPALRERFGSAIFDGNQLNREALGRLVFSDAQARADLNAILHPMILRQIREVLDAAREGEVVFADIPLLFECGMEADFDQVWVVAASEETQIARLHERDGLSRKEALARIHAQMPLEDKVRRASAVIHTDCPLPETLAQLDTLLAGLSATRAALPPKRQVRALPIETEKAEAHSPRPVHSSLLQHWPRWLRFALVTVLTAVLLTLAAFGTRSYLLHLEERRRLEAEAAERAQHPLLYRSIIDDYAEKRELDPSLIAAIILCESSYNPRAESRLGARGLMQLMEDTAGWIAHRLGEDGPGYSFDQLYDPETNIRFGTWYLRYLSQRFDADPTKIICAYHAGQGNVDSWLKNPQYSEDGVTLNVIPTADTAAYCGRVLRAMEVYRKYYYHEKDDENFNDAVLTSTYSIGIPSVLSGKKRIKVSKSDNKKKAPGLHFPQCSRFEIG